MLTVTTAKGRTVECDVVSKGRIYNVLHMHTHSITPIEAYQIFGDPEETVKLTVTEDGEIRDVFYNFTDIYSVQKSPIVSGENEILIWLNYVNPDLPQNENT